MHPDPALRPDAALARRRWFTIVLARIAGSAGSVFGVVLLGRATTLPAQLLGIAIVLSGLFVVATLPRALAHRWRTPD